MKKHFLFLISFSLVISACDDDNAFEKTCSVENPIEELDWLRSEIESLEQSDLSQYFYVSQANYGNITVFIFGNCCPHCNTIIPVHNCSGDMIGILGNGKDDIDFNILTTDTIIWKPADFSCID